MRKIPQIELDNCIEMCGSKKATISAARERIHSYLEEINDLKLEKVRIQARRESLESSIIYLQNIIENLKP